MSTEKGRLLLYAPNIHAGGGLVLLSSLIESWPDGLPFVAWLDVRAQARLKLPANANIEWVVPSVASRLKSELTLAKKASLNDLVLCFHGLPPLLRNRAKIAIFQQNRNYLSLVPLKTFSWRTRQRLFVERVIAWVFRERCKEYIVQTASMARDLKQWYGEKEVAICVSPFLHSLARTPCVGLKRWDFLYVADGEAHKNHRRLVEAWALLAEQGIKPSLALTLSSRDTSLLEWIQKQVAEHGLRVTNLGELPYDKLLSVYGESVALVFPSISESFGLPLVEARLSGLPIVASELDFVRDVCDPAQSFDPNSTTSIARAVKPFIGHRDVPHDPVGPAEFISAVLGRIG